MLLQSVALVQGKAELHQLGLIFGLAGLPSEDCSTTGIAESKYVCRPEPIEVSGRNLGRDARNCQTGNWQTASKISQAWQREQRNPCGDLRDIEVGRAGVE